MSAPLIFQSKIKIKKKAFARNRERETEKGEIFNRASSGLTALEKILVTVFLTPVVVVTSILEHGSFLMIAKVFLALGFLSNFFYRLYNREVSKAEMLLTIVGIAASITLAVYLFPSVFMVTLTSTSFLACCSVVSTAINSFFLIKNVIIPPVKRMVESVFSYFNVNIREEYYVTKPLSKETDRHVIAQLLGESLNDKNQKKLDTYNRLLAKLDWYKGKYNEEIFGSVWRAEKIQVIDKGIHSITKSYSTTGAVSAVHFISTKIIFKKIRLQLLKEAIIELNQAYDSADTVQYNRLGHQFFDHYEDVVDETRLTSKWHQQHLNLLNAELSRQKNRIEQLEDCIPSVNSAPSLG